MSGPRGLVLGDGRLRVVPWRGDSSTAYLTAARGRPTSGAVAHCIAQLRADGFRTALTAALGSPEQAPFLAAGFSVHERLHLLTRRVEGPPRAHVPEGVQLRRCRRDLRPAVLAVDEAAFPTFWQLDEAALDEAMAATPSSRLRIAIDPTGAVLGYAVTGRAGPRGYLQRLAVAPDARRRGLGSVLVVDSLRWLRRWGARDVMVNTQEGNEAAVHLYQRLGFRLEPDGLAVLRRAVDLRP